jgi:hypothetical protein
MTAASPKVLSVVKGAIFLFGLALLAMLLAFLAAAFPLGFTLRFAIALSFATVVLVAWMCRAESNAVPGKGFSWLLLAIAFLSVAWPRYVFFSVGGPNLNPQTASVLLGFGLLVFWWIFSPTFSRQLGQTFLEGQSVAWIAVLWIAWRVLSSLFGEHPFESLFGLVKEMVYATTFLLFGLAIAAQPNGRRDLLRVFVLAGFFVSTAGVVEAFRQTNFFVQFASGLNSREAAEALTGIMMEKYRSGSFRAQSVFDHPIVFAQFVAALAPLSLFVALKDESRWWRLLAWISLPIGMLAILKSGSRAGLISIAIGFSVIAAVLWLRAVVHGRLSRPFALLSVPALIAGFALAYVVVQELAIGRGQHEISSSTVRLAMLERGINALWDSPVWGFGNGAALAKAGTVNASGLATIDSYLLSIALDSGYVGLLLLALLIGAFVVKGVSALVKLNHQNGLEIGLYVASVLGLFAAFAGLSIANNMTMFWLILTAAFPIFAAARSTAVRRSDR